MKHVFSEIYVWGSLIIYTIKTKLSSLLFFTCLGPGKVSWAVSDVRSMAVSIRMGLPLSVAQIIGADTWKGVGSVGRHLDTSSCSRHHSELFLGQTVCSAVQEQRAVSVFCD